ncbi:hypothetical protein FZC33_15985 [Labrys sp. KNU-23]|uniref:hypothetical protein n=1 Tax=Labrys sp. KNU-23 TaxID=2789216 RepID=UPI0011ECA41B|nr:hypothetical protein [Labrys sp. KNU-23]QEN87724.1 hypothetical protein FZC33_15985 [Labrys sp. KNU-23]
MSWPMHVTISEGVQSALINAATLVELDAAVYRPVYEPIAHKLAEIEQKRTSESQVGAEVVVEGMDRLWLLYRDRLNRANAVERQYHAAYDRLPWWVRPGPKLLNSDGEMHGPVSDLPAIQNLAPPAHTGTSRLLRPSREDLEAYWRHSIMGTDGERPLADALKNLEARLQKARAEEDRVGLGRLDGALDRAVEELCEAKWQILDLAPITGPIAAAQFLIDCIHEPLPGATPEATPEIETSIQRLRKLAPYLSGQLASDVALYLRNLSKPYSREGCDIFRQED